jgi:hypothetical protein
MGFWMERKTEWDEFSNRQKLASVIGLPWLSGSLGSD